MKKLTFALLAVILIPLVIALCAKEPSPYYEQTQWETSEMEGVSAQASQISPSGIILTLYNNSDANIYLWTGGNTADLQSLRGDKWYWVMAHPPKPSATEAPTEEQLTQKTIAIPPAGELQITRDWSDSLGELPPGTYRLAILFDLSEPQSHQRLSTWCSFIIK